jgi:hypothetical protein
VSNILLAGYVPDPKESHKMARSLGYRIAIQSDPIRDSFTMTFYGIIGFAITAAVFGFDLNMSKLRHLDPRLLLLVPVFVGAFTLWRLFSIWSLAPALNAPKPEQCCIYKNDDSLIYESGRSHIVADFSNLGYYYEHADFFAFQLSQDSIALIVPKRAFLDEGLLQFREILANYGTPTNWWTTRNLLG